MREWREGDEASIVQHADNPNVARYMTDRFPHPYTLEDAQAWIALNRTAHPATHFAIEVDGEAVGGIGFDLYSDIRRKGAEIGYWLGEAVWGRGILAAALRRTTQHAFTEFDLIRLSASVLAPNTGSMRVLEKAGYFKEATLRRAAFKNGAIYDLVLYATLRPD